MTKGRARHSFLRGGVLLGSIALITLAGLTFLRWGNDTGIEDFRYEATLPRHDAAQAIDVVAHDLLDRWLRHFTTSDVSWATRLQEYQIEQVDVTQTKKGLIVSTTVRVKPARWSFENWLAGSGGTVTDGWIEGKFMRFALTVTPEGYRLKVLGPGPN